MSALKSPDLPFLKEQTSPVSTCENDQIQVGVIIESTDFQTDANETFSAMKKAKFVSITRIGKDDVAIIPKKERKVMQWEKQTHFNNLCLSINRSIIESSGFHKSKETVLIAYVSAHISNVKRQFTLNKDQGISLTFDELKKLVVHLGMNINIIIVDGCYAGCFTSEGFQDLPIYILGSCGPFEKSKGGEGGLSPFTCYLLEYFEKHNSNLQMEKLAYHIIRQYSKNGYKMTVTTSSKYWAMPIITCGQTSEIVEFPKDTADCVDVKEKKTKKDQRKHLRALKD